VRLDLGPITKPSKFLRYKEAWDIAADFVHNVSLSVARHHSLLRRNDIRLAPPLTDSLVAA
jgi:hypothetical protein